MFRKIVCNMLTLPIEEKAPLMSFLESITDCLTSSVLLHSIIYITTTPSSPHHTLPSYLISQIAAH